MTDSRLLENCPITHSDSYIVKTFNESSNGMLQIRVTDAVYPILPGTVVFCNQTEDLVFNVVVQITATLFFLYSGMDSVNVELGSSVDLDTELGHPKSDVLNVCCLTNQPSKWPYRIGRLTLFKNDPESLLRYGYSADTFSQITNVNFSEESQPYSEVVWDGVGYLDIQTLDNQTLFILSENK